MIKRFDLSFRLMQFKAGHIHENCQPATGAMCSQSLTALRVPLVTERESKTERKKQSKKQRLDEED